MINILRFRSSAVTVYHKIIFYNSVISELMFWPVEVLFKRLSDVAGSDDLQSLQLDLITLSRDWMS